MDFEKQPSNRQIVEEVLMRDEDPIAKVQQIIELGVDEELASDIVERYQIGQQSTIYYEQLPLTLHDYDL